MIWRELKPSKKGVRIGWILVELYSAYVILDLVDGGMGFISPWALIFWPFSFVVLPTLGYWVGKIFDKKVV